MFSGVSSLHDSIIDDKISKLKKIMFFSSFFTISEKHFFAYGFSKKKYKKANVPHRMKEIFFAKKKKERKKEKINVRIEIFEENKRERNLKVINCQKLLYAN